jgi:hypothetical protein
MSNVREQFAAVPMGVNATEDRGGSSMGGFLAKTSGTITITSKNVAATVLVNAVPVTAGFYTPIPILFQQPAGFFVTLAGGASGTLFV